jgi:type VI secretion system protein VasD
MTHRRTLLLLPAALLLARCSPPPKPPAVLNLTMVGSAGQNADPSGKAAPLAIKVYQLSSTAKFDSSDWTALTENEAATLGQDEAAPSQQFVVAPGQTQKQTINLKSGVSSVGIIALYRDIDHAQWRATASVADSGPTDLTLNIAALAITLAPTPKKS